MCKAGMFFSMFKDFEHFLIEHLYRMTKHDTVIEKSSNIPSSDGTFRYKETSWFRQKLLDTKCCHFICCLNFCRLTRQERLFKKARKRLSEELDIIELLFKIRRFEAIIKSEKRFVKSKPGRNSQEAFA